MPTGDGVSIKVISPTKSIIRWRKGDGQKQITVYGTYEEAVAIKSDFLAAKGKVASEVCTLSKLRTQYLKFCEHQKGYYDKTLVTKAILAKFGDVPITSLNTMVLEQYQGELLAKMKPATVNR